MRGLVLFKSIVLSLCVASVTPVSSPMVGAQTLLWAPPHQRVLPLQGGRNFRDLGGYRTADGRQLRLGLLYRSGSMHDLTAADYAYLAKLNIRTVCDLRSSDERQAKPVAWPLGQSPRVLADDYRFDAQGMNPAALAKLTHGQASEMMRSSYPRILAQFNGQYRRMFAELLAGHAPLAFNCSAGKDRTGVAAALLLTALGVPRETVIQDYLLSNRYVEPSQAGPMTGENARAWRAIKPETMRAVMKVDRTYIEAAFNVVDSYQGGVRGYLRVQLGLDQPQLARLRRMYTEE